MRNYRHDPDEDLTRERWEHNSDDFWGLPRTLRNHNKFFHGRSLANVAMRAEEGLANGWALGLDLQVLRDFLAPVPPVIADTLDADVELDDSQLFTILNLPVIIGDRANADRLAALAIEMPLDDSTVGLEVGSRKVRALGLLVAGRPGDAHDDIAAMADLLDSPAASPGLDDKYPNVAAMMAAVGDGDNDAWLAAAAEHARRSDDIYGHPDMGHNDGGLLSRDGAALARLAHVAGMDLPDHPIFAADLIRNL